MALGLAAGAISSVLYIAAQIAANPALLGTGAASASDPPRPLLLFAVVIGWKLSGSTSARDTANCGYACAKFVVPSSGSRYQQ